MANKVNQSPSIPTPVSLTSFTGIATFATSLVNRLVMELREHALRLNKAMVSDGTEVPTAPVMLKPYVKASLPDAATYDNGIIIVRDDVGGLVLAFSDGANWLRVTDRNVIS